MTENAVTWQLNFVFLIGGKKEMALSQRKGLGQGAECRVEGVREMYSVNVEALFIGWPETQPPGFRHPILHRLSMASSGAPEVSRTSGCRWSWAGVWLKPQLWMPGPRLSIETMEPQESNSTKASWWICWMIILSESLYLSHCWHFVCDRMLYVLLSFFFASLFVFFLYLSSRRGFQEVFSPLVILLYFHISSNYLSNIWHFWYNQFLYFYLNSLVSL